MQPFHLQDEFTDVAAEQAVLAAVAQNPTLYFELLDVLTSEVFTKETDTWQRVAHAIETDQPPRIPHAWCPASQPYDTARRLTDLSQRRLFATAQERLAQALFDDTIQIADLTTLLEEETSRIHTALRGTAAGQLHWASALLPQVLADATARRRQREETGTAVLGILTGITRLDTTLNGLHAGLYLLAGPPGVGKTTLALQIAMHVSQAIPVILVTFEHTPENITAKALCVRAGINPQDMQRGFADLETLQVAAKVWEPVATRLAVVEGSSRLTVAQVQAHARRAMHHHRATQCLVIVDYLQLWAKVAEDMRGSFSVRERVEMLGSMLRELSLRLRSPVLALASQNRAQGNYGNGKGSAALDSLKESGDLEYAADVVLFLTAASERQATLPARAIDLTLAKNRHGDTGRIDLIFRPDLGTLREETRV